MADNFWFESRVGAGRGHAFETYAGGATDPSKLRTRHQAYYRDHILVDEDVPHTFLPSLSPSSLGNIDDSYRIVRLECIDLPLKQQGISFSNLRDAFDQKDNAVLDKFLSNWNDGRDYRPAFAASKDELESELAKPDWANLLRDRLGLAHYPGPHDVALMEYTADEVKAAADPWAACPFTAPTVLDSGPWPYFYPAPPGLPCGRAMPLFEVANDSQLLAEILHFRIQYQRKHLVALGQIDRPPPFRDLRLLRNHHLMAVRIAAIDDAFGEDIS